MTTEPPKTKKTEDGLLSFIATLIRKEVPEGYDDLIRGVTYLTEEVKLLSDAVNRVAKIVHEHHVAISQILTVQEYMLSRMKQQTEESLTASFDAKNKSQKPN